MEILGNLSMNVCGLVTSSPPLKGQGFLLHQFGLLSNFCYPVETNPSQAHPHSPWVWFLLTRSSSLVSISPFWVLRKGLPNATRHSEFQDLVQPTYPDLSRGVSHSVEQGDIDS